MGLESNGQPWTFAGTTEAVARQDAIGKSTALFSVVKNDAGRIPLSRADSTDAMPKRHAVNTSPALNRPLINGKDNCIPLAERHDFRP